MKHLDKNSVTLQMSSDEIAAIARALYLLKEKVRQEIRDFEAFKNGEATMYNLADEAIYALFKEHGYLIEEFYNLWRFKSLEKPF